MRVFYVIYIKNKLLRTVVDGIRLLADSNVKQRGHITVRGPYDQTYKLTQKNEIISSSKISIDGIGTFFSESQNTIYLGVRKDSDELKKVWKKDFYKDSFNPHLTLYDGKSPQFAKSLLEVLEKYNENFKFEFVVKELESLFTHKRQTDNSLALDSDFFRLLSVLLNEDVSYEFIRSLSETERLEKIEFLAKNFKRFLIEEGTSKKLEILFNNLGLSKGNGLFYFADKESWANIFPHRTARSISAIKPYAFYALPGETTEVHDHPQPFNEPFLLFFTDYLFDLEDESVIHRKIFSLGRAPAVFIEKSDAIHIYNGLHFADDHKFLEVLDSVENVLNFSFDRLISGETWTGYFKDHYAQKPRVDDYLLANMSETRKILVGDGLSSKVVNALFGRLIFNRYLIDRGVELLDEFIPGVDKGSRNLSFLNLIPNKNRLYDYFTQFNDAFGGELFPITKDELNTVQAKHLVKLKDLFAGNRIVEGGNQLSLFHIYDFQIIPVELISNIYERFLGKEKQDANKAFYTPPFLVDYVLSQTVDHYLIKEDRLCKVLDPSCGSGIFLIETLRKLIEHHLSDSQSGVIKDDKLLWKIIKDNIFGIDIDPEAIDVAIFSLYVTILDYKEPKDIKSIRFTPLKGQNFFCADFFDTGHQFNEVIKAVGLNFIVGNPPWGKVEGSVYREYCSDRESEESKIYRREISVGISDKQIAQAFIVRTSDFLKKDGKCGLVITSKILYNNNGKEWRKYFLDNFQLEQVFELSPVRRQIFDGAIWPSAILFFKPDLNQPNRLRRSFENIVQHISLKPNVHFKHFRAIVISSNDYKVVRQRDFMEDRGGVDWLWKILLHGSQQDYYFIQRLRKGFPSILSLMSTYNLEFNGGLKVVDGSKHQSCQKIFGYKYLDISKREFKPFTLKASKTWNSNSVGYLPDTYFFEGSRMLIKKGLTREFKGVAAFVTENMVFTDSVSAVKASNKATVFEVDYEKVLKSITALLNSDLFAYFIFNTGSSPGVDKPRAYFQEYFAFPAIIDSQLASIVDELQIVENSDGEIFNDYQINKRRELEKHLNEIVNKLYDLSEGELKLIEYFKEVAVPRVYQESKIYKRVPNDDLVAYCNEIRKKVGNTLNITISIHPDFIVLDYKKSSTNSSEKISIVKVAKTSELTEVVHGLTYHNIIKNLYIQKTIKGYSEEGGYLIKPNEKWLWHRATAISDAIDINFFFDLTSVKMNRFSSFKSLTVENTSEYINHI